METAREPRWTIEELGAQAALALAGGGYAGQPDTRVREVPDRRTIRYYTTLGLLDRPAEMQGRTALYGGRHLWQLVAIKRLQARGLSLTEVQQRLIGATDAALRRDAQLPAMSNTTASNVPEREPPALRTRDLRQRSAVAPAVEAPSQRAAGAFWSALPAAPAPSEPCAAAGTDAAPAAERPAALLQAVRLGDELTVLFPASRAVFDDDVEALRTAAAPLARLLKKRRLV